MSKPEDRVKVLARQTHNTICPNCGLHKKFGFSTVCIKFHTFVCNECKASHAAISHRCKSLSMSTWSHQEVDKLSALGNDACRKSWLALAPPCGQGGRPQPGDSIDVYKRFVVQAYEQRKFYTASEPKALSQSALVVERRALSAAATAPLQASNAPKPAPAVADLLDFSTPTHNFRNGNQSLDFAFEAQYQTQASADFAGMSFPSSQSLANEGFSSDIAFGNPPAGTFEIDPFTSVIGASSQSETAIGMPPSANDPFDFGKLSSALTRESMQSVSNAVAPTTVTHNDDFGSFASTSDSATSSTTAKKTIMGRGFDASGSAVSGMSQCFSPNHVGAQHGTTTCNIQHYAAWNAYALPPQNSGRPLHAYNNFSVGLSNGVTAGGGATPVTGYASRGLQPNGGRSGGHSQQKMAPYIESKASAMDSLNIKGLMKSMTNGNNKN